ncbi:MAG: carboxypeptidase-like regulatory domain-containing protein, partial [Thermoplasmata archaeon]
GVFGPAYFCAPSPPGPVIVSVISPGYSLNETWANLPFLCCSRLGPNSSGISLADVTTDHSPVVNLSGPGIGVARGRVLSRLAGGAIMALAGTSVQNCPVVSADIDSICNTTLTNPNGSFAFPVEQGWEAITAAAPGMTSNQTWIDVEGDNSTGTIWLGPPADVVGTVIDPDGVPVAGATVEICPASAPTACRPLGSGFTESGGAFSGTFPGAAFPGGAYRIQVEAEGYAGGSAWGNLTSGNPTNMGSIVLVPTADGSAPESAARPFAGGGSSAPSWIDGTVTDNRTGQPVWDYVGEACPLLSPNSCTALTSAISDPEFGGSFNTSIPGGPTWVNITQPGFQARAIYVNVTGAAVHLGAIALDPLPRVTGRVLFANWTNATVAEGISPNLAEVSLCDLASGVCGVSTFTSTNGTFNVSGPAGPSDTLSFEPVAGFLPFDNLGPGVGAVSESVDLGVHGGALPTQPGEVPELPLYAEVSGRIGDGSTVNTTAHRVAQPLRYGEVDLTIPTVANLGATLTGNGSYTLLVPTGAKQTIHARGASYWTASATFTASGTPEGVTAESMDLGRFGWINLQLVAGSSVQGLAGASVTASVPDPGNNTYVTTTGLADAVGYLNLSAPPGDPVTVTSTDPTTGQTVGTSVVVRPSQTSVVDMPSFSGGTNSYYWLASEEVNTVGVPLVTTVRDPLTGGPLGQADVAVDNRIGQPITSGTGTTNELGQFLVTAPAGANESFSVSDAG